MKKVRVRLILDESGSMEHDRSRTISSTNEFVENLGNDERYRINLTTFDQKVRNIRSDERLSDWRPLTEKDYKPSGRTALFDAVGMSIVMDASDDDEHVGTIYLIVTDGMENASEEFRDAEKVSALIKERKSHGWEFHFFGADLSDMKDAKSMGIDPSNVRSVSYASRASASRTAATYSAVVKGYAK